MPIFAENPDVPTALTLKTFIGFSDERAGRVQCKSELNSIAHRQSARVQSVVEKKRADDTASKALIFRARPKKTQEQVEDQDDGVNADLFEADGRNKAKYGISFAFLVFTPEKGEPRRLLPKAKFDISSRSL